MKEVVDQCLYSLRATSEDCSDAGETDRAALLLACEATIAEALNSKDAEIERLREHAVVLAATAKEVERERCAKLCEALAAEWHTSIELAMLIRLPPNVRHERQKTVPRFLSAR